MNAPYRNQRLGEKRLKFNTFMTPISSSKC